MYLRISLVASTHSTRHFFFSKQIAVFFCFDPKNYFPEEERMAEQIGDYVSTGKVIGRGKECSLDGWAGFFFIINFFQELLPLSTWDIRKIRLRRMLQSRYGVLIRVVPPGMDFRVAVSFFFFFLFSFFSLLFFPLTGSSADRPFSFLGHVSREDETEASSARARD
jgi:hypothetical protein